MSVNLNALSPRQLKEAVREQAYPNSEVERATIAAADKAADAVVSRHANLMQADAREQIETGSALIQAATDLENTMSMEVRVQLDLGTAPSAVAATYERIESDVRRKVADLRHQAAAADLLADRLEDPEDDYERLLTRLPSLRRSIQW